MTGTENNKCAYVYANGHTYNHARGPNNNNLITYSMGVHYWFNRLSEESYDKDGLCTLYVVLKKRSGIPFDEVKVKGLRIQDSFGYLLPLEHISGLVAMMMDDDVIPDLSTFKLVYFTSR